MRATQDRETLIQRVTCPHSGTHTPTKSEIQRETETWRLGERETERHRENERDFFFEENFKSK